MVKIRLARKGNRKRPFYRVVVAEEAHRRDGRFIEIVGTYDPLAKPAAIEVKADAIVKWLGQGAQPTDTVKRILARSGVWAHWKAVKAGTAEAGAMEGRVQGTVERERTPKPSDKAKAKIAAEAEEASKAAEEAAAAESSEGDAADGAEATEEASS